MENKTFEAIYLPGDNTARDPSKGGFESAEKAWDYIMGRMCVDCEEAYRQDGEDAYMPCLGEWMVDQED